MSWLARLKALRHEEACYRGTDETDKTGGFVSFVSAQVTQIPWDEGVRGAPDAEREAWEERALVETTRPPTRYTTPATPGRRVNGAPSLQPGPSPDEAPMGHGETRWPMKAWGDLRPCTRCRNLARSGLCLSAARGGLRAARDYEPSIPAQPRRCIGYWPTEGDPDRRPGRERWPELIEWQQPERE